MAGDSSSTTATAKLASLGGLHALSIASAAERHLDWRWEQAGLHRVRMASRVARRWLRRGSQFSGQAILRLRLGSFVIRSSIGPDGNRNRRIEV